MKKLIGISAMIICIAASASATLLTDGFSIGLGYNALDGTEGWDDAETFGANTYVGGDFTLDITHTAAGFSGAGPQFPNRVLAGSGANAGAATVVFTVDAAYTGGLAGSTATPMTLVIDSISIYAFNHSAHGDGVNDTIRWAETTAGNAGTSSWLDLGAGSTALSVPAAFDQLVWNPGDVAVAGTTSTRTFTMNVDSLVNAAVDGFEIEGHIEYDAIPEPATLGLVAVFGGGILLVRRKLMI